MPGDSQDHLWRHLSAPLRLALEVRAGWELGALFATAPLLALAPRGDGHPVMVLPRLLGCDISTEPLRRSLDAIGYAAHPWGLGINTGPRRGVLERCRDCIDRLHESHGRTVSLVGWSAGGLYARELAKQAPHAVRCVISLGAPIDSDPKPAELWRVYEQMTGEPMGMPETHGPLSDPPPVPSTAIVSRSDGIVPWPGANEPAGPLTETIEIESSHMGLAMHPLAVHAIADRLAQPEGQWQPFRRDGIRALLYADPTRASQFPW